MCFTYQKFHACNARVGYDTDTDTMSFVSYDTRICEVTDDLIIVGICYDRSPATRKQFSRFLRENDLPSYASIKKAEKSMLKESGAYTGEIFQVEGHNVTFSNAGRFAFNANDFYDLAKAANACMGVIDILCKIDPC